MSLDLLLASADERLTRGHADEAEALLAGYLDHPERSAWHLWREQLAERLAYRIARYRAALAG